jgi:hypothetical protein
MAIVLRWSDSDCGAVRPREKHNTVPSRRKVLVRGGAPLRRELISIDLSETRPDAAEMASVR